MVRNQENAQAAFRQRAHGVAQLHLRADVQRIAGLVEQQGLRLVHQRACDQRALGLTGGHLRNRSPGKVCNPQAGERHVRLFE